MGLRAAKAIIVCICTLILGCAGVPRVGISQLEVPKSASPADSSNNAHGRTQLTALINAMRGRQFGDPLFSRRSAAIWMVPEIYKLDLDLTAREENFSPEEYARRFARLVKLHGKYLVFFIDLRMPLNPKITKDDLIDFLKENLSITLHDGHGRQFVPESITFRTLERLEEREVKELLKGSRFIEVSTPMRVLFKKGEGEDQIITSKTKKVVLKLRLKNPPPYNIGYFDQKFFQGYIWKIDHRK